MVACVVQDYSVSLAEGERGKKGVLEPLLERGRVRLVFIASDRVMLPATQRGDHVHPLRPFPRLLGLDLLTARGAALFALAGASHSAFVHVDAFPLGYPPQLVPEFRALFLGPLAVGEGFF